MTATSAPSLIDADSSVDSRWGRLQRLRRSPSATVDELPRRGSPTRRCPRGTAARRRRCRRSSIRFAGARLCVERVDPIGFYVLQLVRALFDERAQEQAFATRPFLAPAPLAPTGRGLPRAAGSGSPAGGRGRPAARQLDHRRRMWTGRTRSTPRSRCCTRPRSTTSGTPMASATARTTSSSTRVCPRTPACSGSPRSTPAPPPRCTTQTLPFADGGARWSCGGHAGAGQRRTRRRNLHATPSERVLAYEGVMQKDNRSRWARLGGGRGGGRCAVCRPTPSATRTHRRDG